MSSSLSAFKYLRDVLVNVPDDCAPARPSCGTNGFRVCAAYLTSADSLCADCLAALRRGPPCARTCRAQGPGRDSRTGERMLKDKEWMGIFSRILINTEITLEMCQYECQDRRELCWKQVFAMVSVRARIISCNRPMLCHVISG